MVRGRNQAPSGEVERAVHALIRQHLEEGCRRAWSELAETAGVVSLFPSRDPSTMLACLGIRSIIDEVADDLTEAALAALLLPSVVETAPRPSPPRILR